MQLVLYMNAVMEKEQGRFPEKNIRPAALLYYQMKDPLVEKEEAKSESEQKLLKELRPNGVVNDAPEVIAHLDREVEKQSSVIPITKNKDGSLSKQSSALSEEKLRLITSYANEKAKKLGTEILKGNVDIAPYEMEKHTGCDYCPYHGVCGFDERIPGYQYRKIGKESKEEILSKMEQEVQSWE